MVAGDFDSWAEFYDIIYSDKDKEDVQFYIDLAEKHDRVLELGCGTGRVYLKMLERGVDAVGVDISENMLGELREKAEEKELEPEVYCSDMASFEIDGKFDLITIPFRSFLHNIEIEEQLDTLKKCYDHLEDGGRLVLNFFMPDPFFISSKYVGGPEKTRDFEHKGSRYELYQDQRIVEEPDMIAQLEHILYCDDERIWKGEFKLAMVSKREFQHLLERAGFSDYSVYGGFNREELEAFGQEMVWEARK